MTDSCIRWMPSRTVVCSRHRQHPRGGRLLRCRHRYLAGPVAAALRITVVSSALSVERLSLRTQAGPAAVVLEIRASSVPNAEQRSRKEHRSINVINAAGSRKILHIRLSSARSAAILLMTTPEYNTYSSEYIYRKQYSRYLYDICCTELL